MNARSRASAGLGRYHAGKLDQVRVDLFHVDDVGPVRGVSRQVQVARSPAATQHQHLRLQLSRGLEVGGVGHDLRHSPEPDRLGQVGVGQHHYRDRAQPGQRGDRNQRAGPRLHQHAHAVALAHTDFDQAANHVVDAAVDGLVGVHAAVEQQEFALRGVVGLLLDDAAQRYAGVVVDLPEAGQPRQRSGGLHCQRAHRFVGGDDRVDGTAGQRDRRLGELAQPVREARTEGHAAIGVFLRLVGHQVDVRRLVTAGGQPLHPLGDGRPTLLGRPRSHHQPEMPCADEVFEHLGVRRRAPDPAHGRGLADVVDLADERQYRAGDVGECDHLPVDGETAAHHPVVRDELLEQLGDRRARPGDPAFGLEKPALLLARQQGLAVVQLAHEVDPRLRGLERVHQSENRCAPSNLGYSSG